MASAQLLQLPRLPTQFPRSASQPPTNYQPCPSSVAGEASRRSIRCSSSSSSNGRSPEPQSSRDSSDQAVKEVERLLEEKRRAELGTRIASDEFTISQSGFIPMILSKLGRLETPQARGSIAAVGEQAFFLPLYELFLTYGGIFRLNFGPKVNTSSTTTCLDSSFS